MVRTCVGCRHRAAKSELLRVVLARDGATAWLVPDVSGRAPGRGAHLHPTRDCLGLAERRRAFPRALRAEVPVGLEVLRQHVEQLYAEEQGEPSTDQPAVSPALGTTASAEHTRRLNPGGALNTEGGSSGS